MTRRRLDAELVRRKLVKSRVAGQALIDAGQVFVGGQAATKAATMVEDSAAIEVVSVSDEPEYVSRGAHKLLGALEAFGALLPPIEGAICMDAGISTGGFTEVLLRRGAAKVVGVDVGYGQLAWSLRQDPRVRILERTNIRHVTPEEIGVSPSIIVADLSFISLTKVISNLVVCGPLATMMLMVKPQFEVGKGRVGAGGVVRDRQLQKDAIRDVALHAISEGLEVRGIAPSPLPGPAGNVEYFLLLAPARHSENGNPDTPSTTALSGDALLEVIDHCVETGPLPPKNGASKEKSSKQ